MTNKRILLLALLFIAFLHLGACDNEEKERVIQTKQAVTVPKKPKQQETRDAHGCLTSEGYIWSAAKDTCIRLWESAMELSASNRSEFVVFAVISEDKLKAEIFIPGDSTVLLQGQGNGTYSNDSLSLLVNGNNYVLRHNGQAIYQTASAAPPEEPKPKPKSRPKKKR